MRTVLAFAVGLSLGAGLAFAKQPSPVIRNLGAYLPTPAPSPNPADRIRMVTSLTVQNKPDSVSTISFEVTDFARSETEAPRIIASEVYSTMEEKRKGGDALRERIEAKIRGLEEDILDYVEQVGPPREREPVTSRQSGSQRPY